MCHVVRYFKEKGYLVFTERYAGLGRADVVGVKLDMDEVVKRVKHGVPRLPIRTLLRIMRILDKYGEVSMDDLAKRLGLSFDYVRKIVSYVNPLFLKRDGKIVKKIGNYKPFTREVILVEVKVGDWRSGLVQADTYLLSGHKSYLAIYKRNYHYIPEKVLLWARNKGVGILTISKGGMIEEKIPAKKVGPKSLASYYVLVESLWEKVLSTDIHLST